jgi:hypothetical protein
MDLHDDDRSLQSSSSSSFSTAIAKLTASNRKDQDRYASDNAVVISNNRIFVGAYAYNVGEGAVFVYGDPSDPRSGRSYSELAILYAADRVTGRYFGDSIAIDGDTIVIGASTATGDTPSSGSIYVFKIIEDSDANIVSISQQAKLTARLSKNGDYFGWSVAIRGNFILVGAIYRDWFGSLDEGSAYLFGYLSTDPAGLDPLPTWTELQWLRPDVPATGHQFGWSVALDDNIAVVGTFFDNANSVYVFEPGDPSSIASAWTQVTKLTGPTNSGFGRSVALAENWILVGATYDDTANASKAGVVYVFTKSSSSSSSWTQMTRLSAADGAENDCFGNSVAMSKDASTIVVGASSDNVFTITKSGAAYLFRATNLITTTSAEWNQVGKFVLANPTFDDRLGSSVAMEDNIVVVGADRDDFYVKGSAYVLDTGFDKTSPSPSSVPSRLPSFTPSTTPSVKPSRIPSAMPSGLPSSMPSFHPSTIPSQSPSAIPSGLPSSMPSSHPSTIPSQSSMPSGLPSSIPSFRPSPVPNGNPGSAPGQATDPWNAILSFVMSGIAVIGLIACILL